MTKLDRCWKNCLRMWKWISENWKPNMSVRAMKEQWLKDHRYGQLLSHDCFFCDYDDGSLCGICPGRGIEPRFKDFWCENTMWDWRTRPKAFYLKLLALDKKRRTK